MSKQTVAHKKKTTAPLINLLGHQQHLTNLIMRRRHERIRKLTQFRRRKP
jgi:hypothetical protein